MINILNTISEKFGKVKEQYGSKKVGIFIAAIFFVVVTFTAAGCGSVTGGDVAENTDTAPVEDSVQAAPEDGTAKIAQDGAEPAPPEAAAIPADDSVEVIANKNEKMVALSVEDAGRANPFVPYGENTGIENSQKLTDLQVQKLKYDLIDPPQQAVADADAQKVLTTKVSGIMYDKQNPSAILNIESSDYLVRSGDVVNGYKVLSISPQTVTVQLGANVYKAGVGELLATDGLQYNTISNLDKKFGGSKK